MTNKFNKIIASLAITGLAVFSAGPAMASAYDPNDPSLDPSGTYVPPVIPPNPNVDQPNSSAPNAGTESNQDKNANNQNPIDSNNTVTTEAASNTPAPSGNGQDNAGLNNVDSNSQTGSDSINEAANKHSNSSETEIKNDSNQENNINAASDTGSNETNSNTGDGNIKTGNADLVANIINSANSIIGSSDSFALPIINLFSNLVGDLVLDQPNSQSSGSGGLSLSQIVSNFLTGNSSSNQSGIDQNNSQKANLNNQGLLDNNLVLKASTGSNQSNENTGNGNIITGNANIAANLINFLNTTIFTKDWLLGMVNIFGDWNGNLILPSLSLNNSETNSDGVKALNGNTGADSENLAKNDILNNSTTNITNDGNINDGVEIDANTGRNEASKNTIDGNVETGDANIKNNQFTLANNTVVGDNWWMMIVNTLKGWSGAIIGSPDGTTQFVPMSSITENSQTGAASTNDASIANNTSQDVEIKNDGDVKNKLVLNANTGENSASKNTGSGEIRTGDANIMSNLVNFVNNTFNVKKWMFGIVNVFGTWDGNAMFKDSASPIISSSNNSGNTSLSSSNGKTGNDSTNDASNNLEQKVDLKINNELTQSEKLNIKANTGNNVTEKNSGNGTISSGNIGIDSSIAAIGNITELAGNFNNGNNEANSNNSNTGTDSFNTAKNYAVRDLKVAVNNVVNFVKQVKMDLQTGNNTAEKNTGDGSVNSGDIRVSFLEKEVFNQLIISDNQKENKKEEPGEVLGESSSDNSQNTPLGSTLPLSGIGVLLPITISALFNLLIRKR